MRKGVGRGMQIKIIYLLFSFFLQIPLAKNPLPQTLTITVIKPVANMFLISSGSSWLQILSPETAAQFFSGESTAYIAAWRGFEQQSQLQGQWLLGGELCQVLEAREPLREHREVTGVRVPVEVGRHRQHLSDTHKLVEIDWSQAKMGCKEKLSRVDVGKARLRGSIHGSLCREIKVVNLAALA